MTPAPIVEVSFLVETDATGRCRTALDALARRRRGGVHAEVIGVSAGGAALAEELQPLLDWHLTTAASGPAALEQALAWPPAAGSCTAIPPPNCPTTWPIACWPKMRPCRRASRGR
jgi:hypothetical protein